MKEDIYTTITDRVISDLEQGARPWLQPWKTESPNGKVTLPERADNKPFNSINVLALWSKSEEKGYSYNKWMTARQAAKLGGQILEEEIKNGTTVGYNSSFKKTETNDQTGEVTDHNIPFMKGYKVYNVQQISGLPNVHYDIEYRNPLTQDERAEAVSQFLDDFPADIRYGGKKAFYTPGRDYIQMPHPDSFKDADSYFGTLINQIMHWTRHPSRLNRIFDQEKYGLNSHAMEKLVGEIGSSLLAARLGTVPFIDTKNNSTIQSFIKLLKEDKRAIFKAATLAQKAVDYVQKLQAPDIDPGAELKHEHRIIRNHNKGGSLVLG